MREQFRLWAPINVRWSDMDAMGHVNNAKYFTYLEASRLQYFETVKIWDFRETEHQGPALVSATCNFRQQVRFPAQLDIGARIARIGEKSLHFEHVVVYRDTEDVVADGVSVGAWVDYAVGKSIPIPPGLRQAIKDFEGLD